MIRYLVDVAATASPHFRGRAAHRAARPRAAPEPAGVDSRQLPGARVRAPSLGAAGRAGRRGACRCEQLDKATWLARCDGARRAGRCATRSTPSTPRCAPPFSMRARGFFNGTGLCLRVEGREARAARARARAACRAGWQVATTLAPQPGRRGARVRRRRLRRARRPSGRARPLLARPLRRGRRRRTSSSSPAPCPTSTASACSPTRSASARPQIAFWHGTAASRRSSATCSCSTRVDDGHGGLEHRASTALVAPRRDLPRARPAQRRREPTATSTLLGLISHEYFHTWNVKRLKPREFARLDYTRENYTAAAVVLRRLHLVLRRPVAAARRPDRRGALPEAARQDDHRRARHAGPQGAERRRRRASTPGSSTTAATRTRRTRPISYYAKGALVALALDLTLRGEGQRLARRRDARAVGSAATAGRSTRPTSPRRSRRSAAARTRASSPPGCTAPTSCRCRRCCQRFGVDVERAAGDARAAPRRARQRERADRRARSRHVLRGGAAERAGLAAGDELIAVDGWRLRRLDDALRVLPRRPARRRCCVARDQRVLDAAARPRPARRRATRRRRAASRADEAGAEAASRCGEAWLAG